jgi:hypothetical protein
LTPCRLSPPLTSLSVASSYIFLSFMHYR